MRQSLYQDQAHKDIAVSLNNVGLVHRKLGEDSNALKYLTASLEMKKTLYKDQPHVSIAASYCNLAVALTSLHQYDEAIKCYNESLSIRKLIYGDKAHLEVGDTYNNLGLGYYYQGNFDKAIDCYEKSITMYKDIYGDSPRLSVARVYNNLAGVYDAKAQYKYAIENYSRSLKILDNVYDTGVHPHIAAILKNLASAYESHNMLDEAIIYYLRNLQVNQSIHGNQPHPDIAVSACNLGNAYKKLRKYDEAMKYNCEALKIISYSENHPYNMEIDNSLKQTTLLFANQYSLRPEKIMLKALVSSMKKHTFTNCKEHFEKAISLQNSTNYSIEEVMEEYLLALIFTQSTYSSAETSVVQNIPILVSSISSILNVSIESIELWFAVACNDISATQDLMTLVEKENTAKLDTLVLGRTLLIQAIVNGQDEIILKLLTAKADINKPNNEGATPLYCALGYYGQPTDLKIVELLLQNGADPNIPMNDCDTPMHMAHYKANAEAIKQLLKYHANINTRNQEGKTPLHCLLEKQDIALDTKIQIIGAFLHEYDLSVIDSKDQTAIDYAAEYCPEILSILLSDVANDGDAQQQQQPLIADFVIESNAASSALYVNPLGESE